MVARATVSTRLRTALLTLASACLLGTIVELAAWFVEGRLARYGIVYRPQPIEDYDSYLRRRDPINGWPWPGQPERDASGSRIIPAFPDPTEKACVSVYGDSFVWGDEVLPQATWGNVLAERLRCRVSNFGVNAYGTDQSYLRFANNIADRAPVTVLCFMSENIVRNVNQFRPLLYPGRQSGLKPRFVLAAGGALELIPLPTLSADEYARMVHEPAAYLQHEAILPGTEWGPVMGGFPHTVSVLLSLRTLRIRSYLAGSYYWNDFYRSDHPTQALAITAAILESFVRDARRQQRHPVVLVFPAYADALARRRGHHWSYQPLLDALQAGGITALNVGDGLFDRRPEVDPAQLFVSSTLHYNEAANRLVAELIAPVVDVPRRSAEVH